MQANTAGASMPESYYTLESLDANKSLGFLIKRCGIVMTQIAERRFESQPVSFTQWMVLMWLVQRPHASPSELSAHLGHDMGALTRVADELERDGMVRRERSQRDRRAVELATTPDGSRQALAGKQLMVELLNELVAPYTNTEVDILISLLQRLLSRLQDTAELSTPSDPQSAASNPRGNRRSPRASPKSPNIRRDARRKRLK
jgi:DNA-binding MarR family transcriptional regulator